jgi:adenylate kinase family enzyme
MYNQKRIRYKFQLRSTNMQMLGGGKYIIHISGSSGSGKTTLGNKLKNFFGSKVIVKDLDDLREEHFKHYEGTDMSFDDFINTYHDSYQKWIDEFIKKNKSKTIIFVGINTYVNNEMFWFKEKQGKYPAVTFDTHADYKYFIKISDEKLIRQLIKREMPEYLEWFKNSTVNEIDDFVTRLVEDESEAKKELCNKLVRTKLFDVNAIRSDIKNWDRFYREEGYKFMEADNIYDDVLEKDIY